MKKIIQHSALAIGLSALAACGGGSGSDGNSDNNNVAPGAGNGNASGHQVDADKYVSLASWAYLRIANQEVWARGQRLDTLPMENSLDGIGGIFAPYNMDTRVSHCQVSGTINTQYIVTAPSIDAGDVMVQSHVDCVENVLGSQRTQNSVKRVEILSGSYEQNIEMRSTFDSTVLDIDGKTVKESYDFSYLSREDSNEDAYFEAIALPGSIISETSDSVTINQFILDENGNNNSYEADLDVTVGSVDQPSLGFSRFRLTTIDKLQEMDVPDDDDDSNGREYMLAEMQSGGVKIVFDNLQVVTVVPENGINVRVSLDSDGNGTAETSQVLALWEFRQYWAKL